MSGRQTILDSLCERQPDDDVSLPPLDGPWTTYRDPRRQFCDVLASVGGRAVVVPDMAGLNAELASLAAYRDARRICSLLAGAGAANVDPRGVVRPHELADVDFCIAPGEFAVAENGAVWVTDRAIRHRALYFLTQHLALVVPATEILHNLHEAYARLAFDEPHFGLFLSGPSKTADIEQALVIGAHGPRSLTVFLLETPPDDPTQRGPRQQPRKETGTANER